MMTTTLRVALIARGLTKGGVQKYITNVVDQWNKEPTRDAQVIVFTDNEGKFAEFQNIKVVSVKASTKLLWDYWSIIPFIRRERVDAIIYPKNIIPITHWFLNAKKINVINDLGYFIKDLDAYRFWDSLYMKAFTKISCFLADKIVAISEHTKQDIVDLLLVDREKIKVVHLGVDGVFRRISDGHRLNETLSKYQIARPFLFYPGTITPRKNLRRLLQAFQSIKDQIPHDLVVTGTEAWGSNEVDQFVKTHHSQRVKQIGFVNEAELVDLYNLADACLYPSLYEGFGLPIIEAQACGCPVLTSNTSSCPEVAGGAAIMVNPYVEREIADGILSISKDRNLRDRLIDAGFQNAKRFRWGKTAGDLLNTCTEL